MMSPDDVRLLTKVFVHGLSEHCRRHPLPDLHFLFVHFSFRLLALLNLLTFDLRHITACHRTPADSVCTLSTAVHTHLFAGQSPAGEHGGGATSRTAEGRVKEAGEHHLVAVEEPPG